jgi:hypothetical protein
VGGLVAAHFEEAGQDNCKVSSTGDLFGEKKGKGGNIRVGVSRSDQGGWVFRTVAFFCVGSPQNWMKIIKFGRVGVEGIRYPVF